MLGALVKGYIKSTSTGVTKLFMYNPDTLTTDKITTYSQLTSPGSSYPTFQYVGGMPKEIDIKLFLAGNNVDVQAWIDFLETFQPVEDSSAYNTAPPSTFIFCFGNIVKECIMQENSTEYQLFDSNLHPTMAVATLTIQVVA